MRRRSTASSKLANARSRKAKTLKAARHRSSLGSEPETEVVRLTRELHEAQEQQTATAEVLQPVFSAILESAARLCDASFGNIFRWDDDALRLVATYNTPAAFVEARSRSPLQRNQDNPIGEMLAAKTVLQVDEIATLCCSA